MEDKISLREQDDGQYFGIMNKYSSNFAPEPLVLTHPLPYGLSPEAKAADFWPTPAYITEALLATAPPPKGLVLEPAAGNGAIVKVLRQYGHDCYAIELREEERAGLEGLCPTTIGDWIELSRDFDSLYRVMGHWPRSIITNPPFSIMLEYAKACIALSALTEYIALLLPTAFLHSQERRSFNFIHRPTGLRPIARRPSFGGGGTSPYDVTWFIWERGKSPLDIIPVA